ncbi:MAG: hypothetical protein WC760_06485 [Bacteroidia bacterium]|jgi:hypothetical protein
MKTINIGKIKGYFPETMGELTEKQLIELAECYTGNLTLIDAKVLLARKWAASLFKFNEKLIEDILTRIRNTDISSQKEMLIEKLQSCDHNRYYLSELASWITEPMKCDRFIISRIKLRRKWGLYSRTFVSPSVKMGNVQFWEWCKAEMYFMDYTQNDNREAFNKFCACLYHPALLNGARGEFKENVIEHNAKYFARLNSVQVMAIRLNYIAVKGWMAAAFPHVFNGRKSDADIGTIDMVELLYRSAEKQRLDRDLIAKKSLLAELYGLNLAAKDFKEQEANSGKDSRND